MHRKASLSFSLSLSLSHTHALAYALALSTHTQVLSRSFSHKLFWLLALSLSDTQSFTLALFLSLTLSCIHTTTPNLSCYLARTVFFAHSSSLTLSLSVTRTSPLTHPLTVSSTKRDCHLFSQLHFSNSIFHLCLQLYLDVSCVLVLVISYIFSCSQTTLLHSSQHCIPSILIPSLANF